MDSATILVIVITVVFVIGYIVFIFSKASQSQNMKDSYNRNLRIGMSRSEVIALFGEPTTVGRSADGTEVLHWTLNESSIRSAFDKDPTRSVKVVIKDGKVVSYDGHNINKSVWI